MKVTPYSEQPYNPMLLSNGSDALSIGYTGSMVAGVTDHSHFEQHQGCPCGWYKVAHASAQSDWAAIQPIAETGYQVIENAEVCDISDFTQEFDPATAVLKTQTQAGGVRLEITSFLTDDHILVERYEVLQTQKKNTQLVLFTRPHRFNMGAMTLASPVELELLNKSKECIGLAYRVKPGTISGCGSMLVDHPSDFFDESVWGLGYQNVQAGTILVKYLALTDELEAKGNQSESAELTKRCKQEGFETVLQKHTQRWLGFSNRSRVEVPDAEMQYLFDISSYMLRASQFQPTGATTCGQLPTLWRGGICCPYDGHFAQLAMLANNYLEEAESRIGFHLQQEPSGRQRCEKLGLPGVMTSGWCDVFGNDKTENIEDFILHTKPFCPAFVALDCYWQWRFDPSGTSHKKTINMIRSILELALVKFIKEMGDSARMLPCKPANESDIEVESDTFNAILYAKAFAGFAEMLEVMGDEDTTGYKRIAKKLYKGLAANYQGEVLMPYLNAKYSASLQFNFFICNLPEGINNESIYACLADSKTPWGLNTVQPSERYRDWPWFGAKAAIALACMKDPENSFKWLLHTGKHRSSLGAIPEKIRMDGYAIGYWYTTCHALLRWGIATALAHLGKHNELRLLWGMDGQWRDLNFENIRTARGLLVSNTVQNGDIKSLSIVNTAPESFVGKLDVNPRYTGIGRQELRLDPGQKVNLV